MTDPNNLAVVFRVGSTGEFVRKIQTVVGVTVDGIYGPQTEAAVKAWQAKIGVAVDGVWGPNTQAATKRLFEYIAATKSNSNQVLASFLNALSEAMKQTLRVGSRGGSVAIMQNLLVVHGVYLSGGVDGVFGSGTDRAVRQFQSSRGLVVDGVVGPNTWVALVR